MLDHTAWNRFTVRLDRANGTGWQPLTKKLHGALSGGERAVQLPLFAAVAGGDVPGVGCGCQAAASVARASTRW
ncbi:SbcC/MukB-like Walker B domain-containing protein [Streptomyces albogriseolus]|uniref:SbcC/MukB-like Walker B domain-containing protein n=1 Tax=Streptomyces albogriseolus TaxID=1887 RepID=UPI00346022AD